mmetsp:Transcript_51313/g.133302  ORF Transcript_51313/g.133302 Transcript_51313/m.133302 type:complete len:217 (-) Transcript_51313:2042-2692(-)
MAHTRTTPSPRSLSACERSMWTRHSRLTRMSPMLPARKILRSLAIAPSARRPASTMCCRWAHLRARPSSSGHTSASHGSCTPTRTLTTRSPRRSFRKWAMPIRCSPTLRRESATTRVAPRRSKRRVSTITRHGRCSASSSGRKSSSRSSASIHTLSLGRQRARWGQRSTRSASCGEKLSAQTSWRTSCRIVWKVPLTARHSAGRWASLQPPSPRRR